MPVGDAREEEDQARQLDIGKCVGRGGPVGEALRHLGRCGLRRTILKSG